MKILLSSLFVKVISHFIKNTFKIYALSGKTGANQAVADQWGDPKYFPPGVPKVPATLHKPTEQVDQCTCGDLKLPYNPNELEKKAAMFYCDRGNINWDVTAPHCTGAGCTGVRISTDDRCHLFCDKVNILEL